MALTKTQQIENTSSLKSCLSKHQKNKLNDKPGSVPATLLTLNLTQTAALVSPIEKGEEFFTVDGNKEMLQKTLTNMNLTDHGAGSNGVKGLPNKSDDCLNRSTSGTKDGPVDLTASDTKSGLNGVLGSSKGGPVSNGLSNATGTSLDGSKVAYNSNTNPTQLLVSSLEMW